MIISIRASDAYIMKTRTGEWAVDRLIIFQCLKVYTTDLHIPMFGILWCSIKVKKKKKQKLTYELVLENGLQ